MLAVRCASSVAAEVDGSFVFVAFDNEFCAVFYVFDTVVFVVAEYFILKLNVFIYEVNNLGVVHIFLLFLC